MLRDGARLVEWPCVVRAISRRALARSAAGQRRFESRRSPPREDHREATRSDGSLTRSARAAWVPVASTVDLGSATSWVGTRLDARLGCRSIFGTPSLGERHVGAGLILGGPPPERPPLTHRAHARGAR